MPEGPEVETIRLGLMPVIGSLIKSIKVSSHRKYAYQDFNKLIGYKIIEIVRKGKFLIFTFQRNNNKIYGLNHLGMTGAWYLFDNVQWKKIDDPFKTYKHYKLYFQFDNMHLIFVNIRTFGRFELMDLKKLQSVSSINNLGPDILDDQFNTDEFIKRIKRRKSEIGKLLLDSKIVSGCGNIYKNESLFRAGINPFTPAYQLTINELSLLAVKLSEVGKEALINKGSTLQDYRNVDGYSGLMQNKFRVYGREGKPCFVCGNKIRSTKQGGRTTFWCPYCQKSKI